MLTSLPYPLLEKRIIARYFRCPKVLFGWLFVCRDFFFACAPLLWRIVDSCKQLELLRTLMFDSEGPLDHRPYHTFVRELYLEHSNVFVPTIFRNLKRIEVKTDKLKKLSEPVHDLIRNNFHLQFLKFGVGSSLFPFSPSLSLRELILHGIDLIVPLKLFEMCPNLRSFEGGYPNARMIDFTNLRLDTFSVAFETCECQSFYSQFQASQLSKLEIFTDCEWPESFYGGFLTNMAKTLQQVRLDVNSNDSSMYMKIANIKWPCLTVFIFLSECRNLLVGEVTTFLKNAPNLTTFDFTITIGVKCFNCPYNVTSLRQKLAKGLPIILKTFS